MTLHLYNTATRRKELFEPLDARNVRMYVCGPTVYDLAHIGNARPVIVFDVLFRLLRRQYGAEHVTYVRNITDVDDKIIAAARESGEPIDRITARTTAAFHADAAELGCMEPTVEPRATGHIAEMQAMIAKLIAAGYAYAADGHVLFEVGTFADYGTLSRKNRDELIEGARVEVAPYKRDPADFVLWKPSTPDQPGWDSPWGRGRPGWHIECSAMSMKHLGVTFDIHGGGRDLIFPHHENEVAQSTCANHAPFARYWVHNGFVTVQGQKMSKSLGNFFTVRDLLAKYPAEAIRLNMLKTHYRHPLDWTEDGVREAWTNLNRCYEILKLADHSRQQAETYNDEYDADEQGAVEDAVWTVLEALSDDLNSPEAIARLLELTDPAYKYKDVSRVLEAAAWLRVAGSLLGILQQDPSSWFHWQPAGAAVDTAVIDDLIARRAAAKKARNFVEADRIRDELKAQGIVLEDKPGGVTEWRRAG